MIHRRSSVSNFSLKKGGSLEKPCPISTRPTRPLLDLAVIAVNRKGRVARQGETKRVALRQMSECGSLVKPTHVRNNSEKRCRTSTCRPIATPSPQASKVSAPDPCAPAQNPPESHRYPLPARAPAPARQLEPYRRRAHKHPLHTQLERHLRVEGSRGRGGRT